MIPFKFVSMYDEIFMKNFPSFSAFDLFDVKPLLEIQKKNFETFSEAGQFVLKGLHGAARCQSEILSQAIIESFTMVNDVMTEGSSDQKIYRQTARAKKYYEQSLANWYELAQIVNKSGKETADAI